MTSEEFKEIIDGMVEEFGDLHGVCNAMEEVSSLMNERGWRLGVVCMAIGMSLEDDEKDIPELYIQAGRKLLADGTITVDSPNEERPETQRPKGRTH